MAGLGHVYGVRDLLVMWYSTLRHSIDVKIMCRVAKVVFLVMARIRMADYIVACLKGGRGSSL